MGRIELQTTEDVRDERWRKYLDRVVRREPQALAELYDESSPLVFSITSRVLGHTADAEEITLDVYTYVWRSAAQFDSSRASVATWLIMLTRSLAIDRLRSIASRADQSGTTRGRDLLVTPVASSNHEADSSRLFAVGALQQLEPADRELLDQLFYSGLSHTELATKLESPVGTAKSRLRAALGSLRKLMGEADVAS
jgi:RNA polymerase sigma-70 factor (ECF subfamily)